MIDLVGMELKDAEEYLAENGMEYTVQKTYAPKPLENTDCTLVIRQRLIDKKIELTVSDFRTHVTKL